MIRPKRSYDIKNTKFNQLDFLMNHLMFDFSQFKLAEKFNDKDEYKNLKFYFHAVLDKNEEEVWSPMKIVRVILIFPDVLFEGLMQNFLYYVVRVDNVAFEFTDVDFPLVNVNDLIIISNILCYVDASQVAKGNRNTFIIGYGHIKAFIDCYYDYFAIIDIELAMEINKRSKVSKDLLKGRMSIEKFGDGEIIHKPFGVFFQSKNK